VRRPILDFRSLRVGRRSLGALVLALNMSACSSARQNPTVLRDTLGVEFTWKCSPAACKFDIVTTTPALPDDCAPGSDYGWVVDHLFSVCYFEPFGVGLRIIGESCRPIVCATDNDCPWAAFGGGITFECKRGLCQSKEAMSDRETLSLCLAKEPRPPTCNDSKIRAMPAVKNALDLVESACATAADGGSCPVPSSCTQP
jgi:hypothetical protein